MEKNAIVLAVDSCPIVLMVAFHAHAPFCDRRPEPLNRRAGVTCITCAQIGRFGVNRSNRSKSVLRPNRENPGYDEVAL
jgi:hypothetical protein